MPIKVSATFDVKSWDEHAYNIEKGLPKTTRATVAKSFTGGLTGESSLQYLMVYADDGSAAFVGLERVKGSIGSRTGSFVLLHKGTFRDGAAKASLTVAPGSGTGDLAGLTGKGEFLADPKGSMNLSLTLA